MDAIEKKPARGLTKWRWITFVVTFAWPIAYSMLVPEAAGRSGYYLGEGIAYGFIVGLVGYFFFNASRDRSLWIQFILICVNVFMVYKLSADRVTTRDISVAASAISESVDYASGKRDSMPLSVDAKDEGADAQTPEQLVRRIVKDVASAAPALRANRDELAQLNLGTVLSSSTLCNSRKRAQARSILTMYKELTLRRVELASEVQQVIRNRVYSYHGAGRDDVIKGFERTEGGSVEQINDLKNVELSIIVSAADVLTLADESGSSIQC